MVLKTDFEVAFNSTQLTPLANAPAPTNLALSSQHSMYATYIVVRHTVVIVRRMKLAGSWLHA